MSAEIIIGVATVVCTSLLAVIGHLFLESAKLKERISKLEAILQIKDVENIYIKISQEIKQIKTDYIEIEKKILTLQDTLRNDKQALEQCQSLWNKIDTETKNLQQGYNLLEKNRQDLQIIFKNLTDNIQLLEKRIEGNDLVNLGKKLNELENITIYLTDLSKAVKSGKFRVDQSGSLQMFNNKQKIAVDISVGDGGILRLYHTDTGEEMFYLGMAYQKGKASGEGLFIIQNRKGKVMCQLPNHYEEEEPYEEDDEDNNL